MSSSEAAPKHLWEIDHPYYAAEGHDQEFKTFTELRSAVDGIDEDMNFVYRWDWYDASQPHNDELFLEGEDRSREEFRVHLILPRKSSFLTFTCPISKGQEVEVVEWLKGPRVVGYLKTMWAPMLDGDEFAARWPRVWDGSHSEPSPLPKVVDRYHVSWVPDEREDGFEGYRSDSHGFREWMTWNQLASQRGPLTEDNAR